MEYGVHGRQTGSKCVLMCAPNATDSILYIFGDAGASWAHMFLFMLCVREPLRRNCSCPEPIDSPTQDALPAWALGPRSTQNKENAAAPKPESCPTTPQRSYTPPPQKKGNV
jgi:hypothetical protein